MEVSQCVPDPRRQGRVVGVSSASAAGVVSCAPRGASMPVTETSAAKARPDSSSAFRALSARETADKYWVTWSRLKAGAALPVTYAAASSTPTNGVPVLPYALAGSAGAQDDGVMGERHEDQEHIVEPGAAADHRSPRPRGDSRAARGNGRRPVLRGDVCRRVCDAHAARVPAPPRAQQLGVVRRRGVRNQPRPGVPDPRCRPHPGRDPWCRCRQPRFVSHTSQRPGRARLRPLPARTEVA